METACCDSLGVSGEDDGAHLEGDDGETALFVLNFGSFSS